RPGEQGQPLYLLDLEELTAPRRLQGLAGMLLDRAALRDIPDHIKKQPHIRGIAAGRYKPPMFLVEQEGAESNEGDQTRLAHQPPWLAPAFHVPDLDRPARPTRDTRLWCPSTVEHEAGAVPGEHRSRIGGVLPSPWGMDPVDLGCVEAPNEKIIVCS